MVYRRAYPPPTRLAVAARTDIGTIRSVNEDTCFVIDLATGLMRGPEAVNATLESGAGVAIGVLDGMGGIASGVEACQVGVAAIAGVLRETPLPASEGGWRERLGEALCAGSKAIFEAAHEPVYRGMGATAALCVMNGNRLHVAHAGDVRVYVMRAGKLTAVTRDDSLANAARMAGMSEDEIEALPKNVVVRALGVGPDLDPTMGTIPLCAGDALVMVSDGLWSVVDDAAIAKVLETTAATEEACLTLLRRALHGRSQDNITVVVARTLTEGLPAPGPEDVIHTPPARPS